MATKHTFREHVLRVIAVIGLIAVLLLGAWGIIQLAFIIPGWFSGLSTSAPKSESLSVSVPAAVTSGSAFPVSWTHKNGSGQYTYSISYSCADGVSVKAPLPTGAAQAVECNTPFNYINASTTSPLIATVSGSKAVSVTFTVSATKLSSASTTVTGKATTSINPAQKSTTTTKPTTTKTTTTKPTTTYTASGRTTNLYGMPDLAVRIVSNPGTVRAGQQVSLQFVVENVGTNVTPSNWNFSATLPYNPVYTYQSQGQQALYPGDKIVYTLGYTATANYGAGTPGYSAYPTYTDPNYPGWSYPYYSIGGDYQYNNGYAYPGYGSGTQTASVTVDPMGYIYEATKANNTASITYQVY